jgi:hypothetical protein
MLHPGARQGAISRRGPHVHLRRRRLPAQLESQAAQLGSRLVVLPAVAKPRVGQTGGGQLQQPDSHEGEETTEDLTGSGQGSDIRMADRRCGDQGPVQRIAEVLDARVDPVLEDPRHGSRPEPDDDEDGSEERQALPVIAVDRDQDTTERSQLEQSQEPE